MASFSADWGPGNVLAKDVAVRLQEEIRRMRSFANRSYSNELAMQKTVLSDFLGGRSSQFRSLVSV